MSTIQAPLMLPPRRLSARWTMLPSYLPVPGLGALPVNSFLLSGPEPMLVDTGLAALGENYLATLQRLVDLRSLRWIWLSHMDADHTGNLQAVLAAAPDARIVTNFLGQGKLMLQGLPADRVHLLEQGQSLPLHDRELLALRPPYYDAPETLGFHDPSDRLLFVSDCFGAVLPAPVDDLADVPAGMLCEGLLAWSGIDAPWLAELAPLEMARKFAEIEALSPDWVLSSHLPPVGDGIARLAGWLTAPPAARRAA